MRMLVQKASGGIALNHSQTGTGRRWVVSTTLRPLYPRQRPGTHFKAQNHTISVTILSLNYSRCCANGCTLPDN